VKPGLSGEVENCGENEEDENGGIKYVTYLALSSGTWTKREFLVYCYSNRRIHESVTSRRR